MTTFVADFPLGKLSESRDRLTVALSVDGWYFLVPDSLRAELAGQIRERERVLGDAGDWRPDPRLVAIDRLIRASYETDPPRKQPRARVVEVSPATAPAVRGLVAEAIERLDRDTDADGLAEKPIDRFGLDPVRVSAVPVLAELQRFADALDRLIGRPA